MTRVLSFTCTPRVHPLTELTIPAFAFPAEADTRLPTTEGWKAELAYGGCVCFLRSKYIKHAFVPELVSQNPMYTAVHNKRHPFYFSYNSVKNWPSKLTCVGRGQYWDGWPCPGSISGAGHLFWYITSHPGQLSLPSLRGRKMRTSFGWEVKCRYGSFP